MGRSRDKPPRTGRSIAAGLLTGTGVGAWAVIFVVPLAVLYLGACGGAGRAASSPGVDWLGAGPRSVGLSAAIAALAVILGYLPGKLLAGTFPRAARGGAPGDDAPGPRTGRRVLLLLLILLPLLLPGYVQSYSWRMLLSPTTALGQYVSSRPELARLAESLTTWAVLLLWHWPVAALILAQGWRNIDPSALEMAHLDAGAARRLTGVVLPLLGGPMLLAFGACFVLSLCEYTTFHLAGVRTVGTDLAMLFQQGHGEQAVARAGWPMVLPAAAVALALWRSSHRAAHAGDSPAGGPAAPAAGRRRWMEWAVLAALLAVSCAVPVGLLIVFLNDPARFRQFRPLHQDELACSALVGAAAGILSLWVARGAAGLAAGPAPAGRRPGAAARLLRRLSAVMQVTVLLAMFLPPALPAVAIIRLMAVLDLPAAIRNSWLPLAAGLAMRYAGLAVIILWFSRRSQDRQLEELSAVDGASPFRAWLHVHLPRHWPLPAGALLMVVMFAMTEVPATMILLPPGLPSFSQTLLNQMHYVRDQDVIIALLSLAGAYLLLAGAATVVLRVLSARPAGRSFAATVLVSCLMLSGCGGGSGSSRAADVKGAFGRTGSGNGEFLYPRAIAMADDGSIFVIDKTGRVQHFAGDGAFLSSFAMPLTENGLPTGLAVSPEGQLWIADTHYNRVMVFTPEGKLLREIGRFGKEGGCFIYPTHVAFAPDGRVFVSEYGGNDRISVFTRDGEFLGSFGRPGEGEGELSRPAAMAVDAARGRLYVADACNHRIAIYDLAGNVLGYFGSLGAETGQMRYPYGLSLLADGSLAVCEFGNNRVQVFSPEGRSLKVFGEAGRTLGQLAYPWHLAVDAKMRAYVVDAGNNRVQIWQL